MAEDTHTLICNLICFVFNSLFSSDYSGLSKPSPTCGLVMNNCLNSSVNQNSRQNENENFNFYLVMRILYTHDRGIYSKYSFTAETVAPSSCTIQNIAEKSRIKKYV